MEAARQQEQQAIHRQQEHGVNQLQNAVSAAAGGVAMRAAMSPAPGRGTPLPGQDVMVDGHSLEKRGPVEFNHAISYVNKIKVRLLSFYSKMMCLYMLTLPTEPVCHAARHLQAIPRDPPDLPARVKANSGRVWSGYSPFQDCT